MLDKEKYIGLSLEYNLFFGRIMKEHLIFIQDALKITNADLILEGEKFKKTFEDLMVKTISLANGHISKEVLASNELVTKYTLRAEETTEKLTGICIDTRITQWEMDLKAYENNNFSSELEKAISEINQKATLLTVETIQYKENLLEELRVCNISASLSQLVLEHVIEEAKKYLSILMSLENLHLPKDDTKDMKIFWDEIMGEHGLFFRSSLDPRELELIKKSTEYARIFFELVEELKKAYPKDMPRLMKENIKYTTSIQEFKTQGVQGILDCKIKTSASPLFLDHVLREANHYLRLLKAD